MTRRRLIAVISNNKGQAMVEFCLILPLLVIIMMFLIITYDLSDGMIAAQGDVRYKLRKSVDQMSEGPFVLIEKSSNVFVDVPGKMKKVLAMPFISQTITLSGYGGCYQQLYKNKYRKRYQYREIKE